MPLFLPRYKSAVRARLAASQAGIVSAVATKILFDTENYDVGSNYASSRWTPPYGYVQMTTRIAVLGALAAGYAIVMIYKNGSIFAANRAVVGAGGEIWVEVCAQDMANGTDYYETYVQIQSGATSTVTNDAFYSNFYGVCV